MTDYFRAIAIDYDGTLTESDHPSGEVLDTIAEVRASGRGVVLVTGRVLSDLRRVFPQFEEHFDAIVAENGAVLLEHGTARPLASPVPPELDGPLVERGVSFQRGQVLLACGAEHESAVFEELRRIGFDCHLVRNRRSLMVLPAGTTKGSGLRAALRQLGLSHHSAIGIGDAENDLALLEQCELGVAVGNAVDALKRRADVVLSENAGCGVMRFLQGPLLRGELRVEPRRWQVDLGRGVDGEPVRLPASQINVLISGGSGSGKSYAAGLLAEQLVALGYSLCIFDPEGDHGTLGRLPNAVTLDAVRDAPEPQLLARLLRAYQGSVIVDLTERGDADRAAYVAEALEVLRQERSASGVPHWIFLDEAHVPLQTDGPLGERFDPADTGFCLVTYRPDQLCAAARQSFHFVLVLAGESGLDPAGLGAVRSLLAGAAETPAPLPHIELGQGVLLRVGAEESGRVVDLGRRLVRHVRHWHKYVERSLPERHRFFFTSPQGPTGAVAGNLSELHREIAHCQDEVLDRHARSHDFSRWVEDVIQDRALAADLYSIERQVDARPREWLRRETLRAIEARYLD